MEELVQKRSTKRELLFALALLLPICLLVGGLGLYQWLRFVPKPNQRFVVQITPNATLELEGVAYSTPAAQGRKFWRANGEPLPDDSFFGGAVRGGTFDRTYFFRLRQDEADQAKRMQLCFRTKPNRGYSLMAGPHRKNSKRFNGDWELTLATPQSIWATAKFDAYIATQGVQVVGTVTSDDLPNSIRIAGQEMEIRIVDSDSPNKGRQLLIERPPLPTTMFVHEIVTNSVTKQQISFSHSSLPVRIGDEHKYGRGSNTYSLAGDTEFTVEIRLTEYDRKIQFGNISLAPEDYTAPSISDAIPISTID